MCGHLNLLVNQNICGTGYTVYGNVGNLSHLVYFFLDNDFLGHCMHLDFFVGGVGDEAEAPSVSEVSGMEHRGDSVSGADPMDCVKCLEG